MTKYQISTKSQETNYKTAPKYEICQLKSGVYLPLPGPGLEFVF